MHLFTAHRPEARRYFANFDLPTHPLCWLRGHRAKAEVMEPEYIEPWLLVTCRTCGIRHSNPYLSSGKGINRSKDEAREAIARQLHAAKFNTEGFERVRDGRDGYGHHTLELKLEVSLRPSFRKPGIRIHLGDRWSETPIDGSIHTRKRAAYFSIGGVGNRLAHRLTNGQERDLSLGASFKED